MNPIRDVRMFLTGDTLENYYASIECFYYKHKSLTG